MERKCCWKPGDPKVKKVENRISPESVKVRELWVCPNCETLVEIKDEYIRTYGK